MDLKIAVPTADFKTIWKEHFGDAPYYLIFRLEGPCLKFVEARKNLEVEEEEHEHEHGSEEKFRAVMEVIGDVDAIAAWDVGPNVAKVKLRVKKQVYIVRGPEKLEEWLDELIKKMGLKVRTLEGEIFYEIIEVNGQKAEHAGFRDFEGEFEKLLFETVGPERPRVRASVTIVIKEEEQ